MTIKERAKKLYKKINFTKVSLVSLNILAVMLGYYVLPVLIVDFINGEFTLNPVSFNPIVKSAIVIYWIGITYYLRKLYKGDFDGI